MKIILKMSLLLGICTYSLAETYYVAPNGSNHNSGNKQFPWQAIHYAFDQLLPGDILLIREGVYKEQINLPNNMNGTEAQRILVKSYPGEWAVIDGTNKGKITLSFQSGNLNSYLIFDSLEVFGASENALWVEGNNNIIRNLVIHSAGKTALILIGNHNRIQSCEIYNAGWNGIGLESRENVERGNGASDGLRCDSNIVEYNYIYDIPNHFGINAFPNSDFPQTFLNGNVFRYNILDNTDGIFTRWHQSLSIYGNLILDNHKDGIMFATGGNDPPADYIPHTQSDIKIFNNVFTNGTPEKQKLSKVFGIRNLTNEGIDIRNNIFYGFDVDSLGWEIFVRYDSPTDTIRHNLFYNSRNDTGKRVALYGGKNYDLDDFTDTEDNRFRNNKFGDPLFTDLANNNYTVQPGSPVIRQRRIPGGFL